jgi:SAM-dependent methyltransferase
LKLYPELRATLKAILPANTRSAIRRMVYFGTRFRCPLCGAKVRNLLPGGQDLPVLRELQIVGGGRLEHDVCPVCFSSSRTRLVHCYLVRDNELQKGNHKKRILHFAPERGISEWLLQLPLLEYFAGDIAPEAYAYASPARIDVSHIEFPDGSFDLVICNHVLEHVTDDRLAMRELCRVLKPGITDPSGRERTFGQRDHVRVYGLDYTERLGNAGFTVDVIDPIQQWGMNTVTRLRLNPCEKLFIGRKRLS